MTTAPLSRRAFLRLAAGGVALGFAPAWLARGPRRAPDRPRPDLEHDTLPPAAHAAWLQQTNAAPERTGALPEQYYAVHIFLVESDRPRGMAGGTEDDEVIACLVDEVNNWFAARLCDRRLRFFFRGPLTDSSRGAAATSGRPGPLAALLAGKEVPSEMGQRQQIHVFLVKDRPGLAWAGPQVVTMTLLSRSDLEYTSQAGVLAHLLGHALGLAHPREDIDTAGTAYASENSFMHPAVAQRGLAASSVLDSPLNPEKARLLASGFFPYRGQVYTRQDGALPLENGMVIQGNDQEIKIALGNYVLPGDPQRAAITVRGQDLRVDLGGALIRGSADRFTEFGEHETYGIGILLDGGARVTLKGGVISGYHYGIKAAGLRDGVLEGVSTVNNRRLWSDASRGDADVLRGLWLNFWETPAEGETEAWISSPKPEETYAVMGAGIALDGCTRTTCREIMAAHNTVGITDFYGRGNCYRESDLSGCAMGLRLWQARGDGDRRLVVADNVMNFNTQPVPWWWSGGDGAAIIGAGVTGCDITGNRIAFGGDGVFLAGVARLPGQTQDVRIAGNRIADAYAHGIEIDFAANCVIEDNTIYRSWLSGVWAGHTAGLLIQGNRFEANNLGRLFGGWTESQGAISCPQGRVTVTRNTFDRNWVAVNLWTAPEPAWWLFCGDAMRHRVAGNTFRGNRVGVRLSNVLRSTVTDNRMAGNVEDVMGDLAENRVADNGPDVDPTRFNVVHMPVDVLLFDRGQMAADFAAYAVTAGGASPIRLNGLALTYPDADHWLDVSQTPDGFLHIAATAGPDFRGIKHASLTAEVAGEAYRIPVKLMVGDHLAVVGKDEPSAETGDVLGATPVGPAVIWGWLAPLSRSLRSERATDLAGCDRFWCRFTQPDFQTPGGCARAFAAVLADDVVELATEDGVSHFASPALEEDQVWEWASAVVDIAPNPGACTVSYTHRRGGDEGVMGCAALWFYPLDDDDLAKLDAFTRARASAALPPAARFSMPGARRFFKPPSE